MVAAANAMEKDKTSNKNGGRQHTIGASETSVGASCHNSTVHESRKKKHAHNGSDGSSSNSTHYH